MSYAPLIRVLDALRHELRHSARALRRSPGFAVAVTLTLGLGIGANAAMLGAIDRLMFGPFPYLRDPGSVHRVYLQTVDRGRTTTRSAGPYPAYLDIEHDTRSFAQYAAFTEWSLALGAGDAATERKAAGVSASFFDFFAARPAIGRFFDPSEDSPPRGADVAILSYDYWQSQFGGRNVIGRGLMVGPLATTIIGVAPRGFVGVSEGEAPAVFIPITTLAFGVNQGDAARFATNYNWYWMNVMVRRKPHVSIATATSDLTRAFIDSREKQRAGYPELTSDRIAHPRAIAGPLRTLAGPDAGLESSTLFWVTGVAIVVLVIACANIANLLLVRLIRGRRETAVRLAMGMTRSRLLAHYAAEGVLIAALGCAAALVVANVVSVVLARMLASRGAWLDTSLDATTFTVAVLLALGTAVGTHLAAAAIAVRTDLANSLRTGTRASAHGHARLQSSLVLVQVGLSVALLLGAVLFVRSLDEARSLRLGWDPDPVLVVTPNYRGLAMDAGARDAFRRRLLEAAQAIPGVAAAARVDNLPFSTSTRKLRVDGVDSVARLGRFVSEVVSPDYFKVMGTRILRGRALDEHDRADAPLVAVVSASMARALWPGRDPIGRCIHVDDPVGCTTVVGVAEDAAETSLSDDERLAYYLSDDQPPLHPANRIFLRVRSDDAAASGERVRRALQRVMPGQAYVTVSPLEDLVDAQRRSWTIGASMFAAFGGLALLVAAIGLYGVISYRVAQRTHELGVRMALGARSGNIVRLVLSQAVGVAAAGVVVGSFATWIASRWMQPLLFHESARDPAVYALVACVMSLVAVIAGATPTLRAVRVDPASALRSE